MKRGRPAVQIRPLTHGPDWVVYILMFSACFIFSGCYGAGLSLSVVSHGVSDSERVVNSEGAKRRRRPPTGRVRLPGTKDALPTRKSSGVLAMSLTEYGAISVGPVDDDDRDGGDYRALAGYL
ncbi:hypothetical protein MRX96_037656 [Rhipicephalus microplus]